MTKDVDLVIRARNESEKAFKALFNTLGEVVKESDAVSTSLNKQDSFVTKLTKEFVALGQATKGVGALGGITGQLDKATASFERLASSIQKQEKEVSDLQSKSAALANTEANLRTQTQATSSALDREKQSLTQLRNEATSTTREIQKMTAELGRLEKAAEQSRKPSFGIGADKLSGAGKDLPNQLPGTSARDSARAILQGQIENSRKVETTLQGQIKSQEAVIERDTSALKSLEVQIRSAASEQRNFQGQIDTASSALERETASLGRAKAALMEIQEAASEAGKAISEASGDQNSAAEAAGRVAQSQARVQAALNKTGEAARAASAETPSQAGAIKQAQDQLTGAQAALAKSSAAPIRQVEESQKDYIARLKEAADAAKSAASEIKTSLKRVTTEAVTTERSIKSIESALGKIETDRSKPLKRGETPAARAEKESEWAQAEAHFQKEFELLQQQAVVQRDIQTTEQGRFDEAKAIANALRDQVAAAKEISNAEAAIEKGKANRIKFAGQKAETGKNAEPDKGLAPTRAQFRDMFAASEIKAGEQALSNAKVKLDLVNMTLEQLQANSKAAGRSVEILTAEADKVTNSAAREAQALREATEATERFAQAQARLAATQAQVAARIDGLTAKRPEMPKPDGKNDEAFSRKAVLTKYKEFQEAQEEVKKLAVAMRDAVAPTEDMGKALGEAQAKARLLKQEYNSLAGSAERMKRPQVSMRDALQAQGKGGEGDAATATAAAGAIRPLADAARGSGEAFKEGEAGATSFRDALKGLYGDSRESLSIMQRIRGEVLALATAYIGVTAAIGGIKSVVEAFKGLEAVQSRLGSVFEQDTKRVAAEVDFLNREAKRLGVSFSVLANEYGKVAIAGKQANFTSEETRKIFLSVAEAGRVTKLSQDQLSGVFLALTQMMSKGKVSSEELRRQLGDRLPGAFGLMAKAVGVSEAELGKMMEAGELLADSSTLLKFAAQLDKQYGGQLPASLKTFTTELGRMANTIEQVALTVGRGGLIDALFRLTEAFNTLANSDTGQKFFLSVGAAAGKLVDGLAAIIPYADKLAYAIAAFVAFRLGMFFATAATAAYGFATSVSLAAGNSTQLTVANRALGVATMGATAWITKAQIGILAMGTEAGVTTTKALVLSGAMGLLGKTIGAIATVGRGLLAFFGGLPGLIATGLTVAAMYWFTGVEKTTDELETHKRLIDSIVTKYEEAKNNTAGWADKIKDASISQLLSELDKAKKSQKELAGDIDKTAKSKDRTFNLGLTTVASTAPGMADVKQNSELFKQGLLSATQFKKELDRIGEANPGIRDNIIVPMIEVLQKSEKSEESMKKLEAAIALIRGTATDAQKRLLGLSEAFKDNGAKGATADMKAFADAMETLQGKIPALAAQMKRLKADTEAYEASVKALNATGWHPDKGGGDPKLLGELTETYGKALKANFDEETKALMKQYGGEKLPLSLMRELKGSEGFPIGADGRAHAYQDVGGIPTIGVGNTRMPNGDAVKMGDSLTKAEAVKLFVDEVAEFAAKVDSAVGDRKLTENQRNALISYVYNVGPAGISAGSSRGSEKTRKIFDSIREGASDEEVATNLANGVATVKGLPNAALATRRKREAATFLRPDDRDAGQDSGSTAADKAKAKADAQQKFDVDLKEATDKAKEAAAAQSKVNDATKAGTSETAAKREAMLLTLEAEKRTQAKKEGVVVDEAALQLLLKQKAAEFDANNLTAGAKEAEEKVNKLYEARKTLIEDLKVAKEQGDAPGIAAAEKGIKGLNEQIAEAIANAIKMWQAIGGVEADTAISKLQKMGASVKQNKTEITTAGQMNEKLASGITNAFDQAAKGIGEAIAGTKSWKSAIAGLGIAFLQFAADFMREIATMILKALILKALQSALGMPGGAGGGIAGFVNAAVAHTGGVVGEGAVGSNQTRSVNPAWFANAQRFHNGGVPGLKPGEVATILQKQEEVLTADDPRHVLNGGKNGGGAAGPSSMKVVPVFDERMIPDAMAGAPGEKVVLVHMKNNKDSIRQILGIK